MAKVAISYYRRLKFDANGHQMAVPDGLPLAVVWLDTAGTKLTAEGAPDGATIARIWCDGKIVRKRGPAVTAATADADEPQSAGTEYMGVKAGDKIAVEAQT